ncbi:MAG: hypothetical protein NC191_09175 [Muribaculaceae bacterium]|nr:hypothetical protein [Muribaculaceae bacterium]
MKVLRIVSAARCAVADRYYITRGAKGKYPMGSESYYNKLKDISGPSTHNPKKIAKSLYKAYQNNLSRINYAENTLHMFDAPSIPKRIFHRLFKK